MNKTISSWQTSGFIFTAVAGTLLHFLYDWTDGNIIVALFSAVNESIWEHMKLLFYPMLVWALVECFSWGRERESFWCIKLIGFLTGLLLIPVAYYTYTGVLGVSADWFNIAIFFFAAGVAHWLETKLFQSGKTCGRNKRIWAMLICLLGIAFVMLTFIPPHIPLFEDPITGTYGFAHRK